jgi:hypothetical protein
VNNFTGGTGSATTPGTLRYALTNAGEGDVISFSGVTAGTTTIELASALPEITKTITIEGNGVTLTRAVSWTDSPASGGLLNITSAVAEVKISGVCFKDGWATSNGGAIRTIGPLTLESCVFSGNQTISSGRGAIMSLNTLTIRGCTFYGNSVGSDGAVYFSATGKTLTLTGNLFYGNTAPYYPYYPVVSCSDGTINASYNIVDVAFGTGNAKCGWAQGTGDMRITTGNPINTTSFRPNAGSPGITDIGIVPAGLAGFPTTDFYGNTRTFPNGAAGAVAFP